MARVTVLMGCVAPLVSAGSAPGAEVVRIELLTPFADVFAGSTAKWEYRVTDPTGKPTQAAWSLTANGRTLARQTVAIEADKDDDAALAVEMTLPDVKLGAVLDARLTVSIPGAEGPLATHEQTIHIFGGSPFAERSRWLEELELKGNKGTF